MANIAIENSDTPASDKLSRFRKKPGVSTHKRRQRRRCLTAALAVVVPVLVSSFGAAPVRAQTQGNAGGLITGDELLFVMGFPSPLFQPTGSPPALVPITATDSPRYGYIKNPYIGVSLGYAGTYGVNYGSVTVTHRVPGRISFGNQVGARLFTSDDLEPLNGFPFEELTADLRPEGYGVWPLASDFNAGGGVYPYNFCAFVRTQVDQAADVNMGFNTADTSIAPTFINNVLVSEYIIARGTTRDVRVRQEIRLFRSMAQMKWIITNNDSVAHNVGLRFTVNVRGNVSDSGNQASAFFNRTGYYFQDPQRGVSDQVTTLAGGQVPNQLVILGKRYSLDDPTDPPFSARHIYRDFGATPPSSVVVGNPFDLSPDAGGFIPQLSAPTLANGIATADIYGPYGVPPGGQVTVTTYYGNGVPTERLDTDFVTATEAPDSLVYDTNAVNRLQDPTVQTGVQTPLDIARQFLTPNPIKVVGGIYNRTQDNPLFNVNLTSVSAVLLLSDGLQFATNPQTNKTDVATKQLGSNSVGTGTGNAVVNGDRDAFEYWYLQTTGDKYGAIPYQFTVSTREFGARTVTKVVNVPATPVKSVTNVGFQMIGFPFQFDQQLTNNGDPSTIINGSDFAKRIGYQTDEPVAFYRWVPDPQSLTGQGGRYELATKLEPGIGYMYRPNLSRYIVLKGATPITGQAPLGQFSFTGGTAGIQQVQLAIGRGWNMISDPYVYEIPFNYLRFVPNENNPNAASQTFQQSIASGLVKAGIFYFDPADKTYKLVEDLNDSLRPWQGYWLFFNSPVSLIYSLPTQGGTLINPVAPGPPSDEPPTRARRNGNTDAIASRKAFVTNPTLDNWRLNLVARNQDGSGDRATIIGVSRSVKSGENTADLPKPPPPVEDYVYVGIIRKGVTTRYAQDIQSAVSSEKTWEIAVEADRDGPVTLSWPNMATMPRRLNLSIKDLATGHTVGMRSASSLLVTLRRGQPSRYQITAKSALSTPLAISGLKVQPTRGGATDITFNLNQPATVTGRIMTISGKVLYNFGQGRAATNGINRMPWNGRAQDGSALPVGSYLVEITATPEDGDGDKRRQPFTTIR